LSFLDKLLGKAERPLGIKDCRDCYFNTGRNENRLKWCRHSNSPLISNLAPLCPVYTTSEPVSSPESGFSPDKLKVEEMKAEGYSEESNILRAEENTEVSSTSDTYELKKTLTLYHGTSKNPLQNTFVSYKIVGGESCSLKVTVETDAQPEADADKIEGFSNTSYDYRELADFAEPYQIYNWAKVRIYLKRDAVGNTAYNELFKTFGKTRMDLMYL